MSERRKVSTNEHMGAMVLALLTVVVIAKITAMMWLWFAVPAGLHPIGAAQAFGLGCLVQAIKPRWGKFDYEATLSMTDMVVAWGRWGVLFGAAYLAHRIAS